MTKLEKIDQIATVTYAGTATSIVNEVPVVRLQLSDGRDVEWLSRSACEWCTSSLIGRKVHVSAFLKSGRLRRVSLQLSD